MNHKTLRRRLSPPQKGRTGSARASGVLWAFALTSAAAFMVTLDNLVVTTAIPVIRHDLHAGIGGIEWTVNAYTLTFAVLLLTGAALGDRFGRRRLLAIGLGIFTLASAAAALAPTIGALDAARAVQGLGGAIVLPLTLTILSGAVPPERRGVALGAWGGISGLAIAFGPLVGGAVVSGISWHWIFWLNVPIGIVLIPLVLRRLEESRGPLARFDLPGLGLASAGLLGIVWGLVRANSLGWGSPEILAALVAGALLTAAFVAWELHAPAPMLPMHFFRDRTFAFANVASLLFSFGMFGSVFLLAQFFQTVQHFSPLASGLRILPWTAMPMVVAPIAGALSDRIGGQKLMGAGLALQAVGLAWIAAVSTPTTPYVDIVAPFAISGTAWGSSSPRSRTSSCRPYGPRSRGRPRARTTRSASSAACLASRCSPRSSRTTAGTAAAGRSRTGWTRPCTSGLRSCSSARSPRS